MQLKQMLHSVNKLTYSHILQVFSTTTDLLKPCIPPPLNYLQFCAIISHSAHMLFARLLPRHGTRSHRMSANVHLLLVFRTTSKTLFQFCLLCPTTPKPHAPLF